VGRRRRECCFAKGVGCPILASLIRAKAGRLQGHAASSVVATPQTHAQRAWGRHRERCSSVRSHRLAARNIRPAVVLRTSPGSGTSHRRSSRCRSFVAVNAHHVGVSCLSPPNISRSMFRVPAKPGILTSSRNQRRPGSTIHARQSLRFVPVMDRARLTRARPPLLRRCGRAKKQVFGGA
jgi:hypothetical protein